MRYTEKERVIICDMSLSSAEAGQLIGWTANEVRRTRQRFKQYRYDLPQRKTGRSRKVMRQYSHKSDPICGFVLNDEISAARNDPPEVLDAKIAKVEQLLINLQNTRDTQIENDKNRG